MFNKALLLFALLCVAAAMTVAGTSGISYAQTDEQSCVTSRCHAKFAEEKYVHGPVAAGDCTVCHGQAPKHKVDPEKYKFGSIKKVADTCYSCHEQFPPRKMMHMPVADGDCTACHNPHASPIKFFLVAKGGALCFACHDDELIGKRYAHGPAAAGGCVVCHDPHSAAYDDLLREQDPSLCYDCHTEKKDAISKAEYVHTAVKQGCVDCHDPHSEEQRFMLRKKSPELCFGCHEDKKEQLANITVRHRALDIGKNCLNCHDPHMSNVANNLLMEPLDLCLSCHNRTYQRKDGKILTNMKKLLDENKYHHGPIRQKDCSGCHDPHGSNNFRILRKPYPATFYAPFAPENYALCFSCHEETIVLDPETDKLTNFRNGTENLHYLHVNKPVKGRTCRACHETHASNFPKHIREMVPFGAWEIELKYEKTPTGGSCTPGCHKTKKYDRVKREING